MNIEQVRFRHLKMQIQRKLHACLALAEQHFKRSFPIPYVDYRLRGVKAGVAYLLKNEIKLNRTLLMENEMKFIQQVVPHELAHLIVYQVFGRVKPHGKEWRWVMIHLFGIPAETCHQFDVVNVRGKTFAYQCGCQIHQLGIRRHNKIQHGEATYFCRKCNERLIKQG